MTKIALLAASGKRRDSNSDTADAHHPCNHRSRLRLRSSLPWGYNRSLHTLPRRAAARPEMPRGRERGAVSLDGPYCWVRVDQRLSYNQLGNAPAHSHLACRRHDHGSPPSACILRDQTPFARLRRKSLIAVVHRLSR